METLTQSLVLLLILSVITEKIVHLIRDYPLQSRILFLAVTLFLGYIGINSWNLPNANYWTLSVILLLNLVLLLLIVITLWPDRFFSWNKVLQPFNHITRHISDELQQHKKKEISFLAFVVGTSIAMLFNVNFLDIVHGNLEMGENKLFMYDGKKWCYSFTVSWFDMLSYLTSGLFLSFGSKFFHDLLDIIFHVKKLKDTAGASEPSRAVNAQELQDTSNLSHNDILKKVYEREKKTIYNLDGVNGFNIETFIRKGEKVRGLVVTTSKPSLVNESRFTYHTAVQTKYQVPVQILKCTEAVSQSSLQPGLSISNNNNRSKYGSLCCIVKNGDGETFFTTCYHVAKHPHHSYFQFQTNGNEEIVDQNGDHIGKLQQVNFSEDSDSALIKITGSANNITGNQHLVQTVRTLDENDEASLEVKMQGANGLQTGIIYGIEAEQHIKFDGLDKLVLKSGLISIGSIKGKSISVNGDSGGLVYTNDGEAVAMIIAGDKSRSYAIPITRMLDHFNVELY